MTPDQKHAPCEALIPVVGLRSLTRCRCCSRCRCHCCSRCRWLGCRRLVVSSRTKTSRPPTTRLHQAERAVRGAVPRLPVNADLDGKFAYLGLDVGRVPIQPGKDVTLTHYWKLVASPGDGWRTFTHLEGPRKYGFINVDHAPSRGSIRSAAGRSGDIIRDVHIIKLPPTWSKPMVEVYVGHLARYRPACRSRRGPRRRGPGTGGVDPRERDAGEGRAAQALRRAPGDEGARRSTASWTRPPGATAPSTGPFVNTMTGGPVPQKTEAKLLWDKKNLYVAIRERGQRRLGEAGQARRQAVDPGGGRDHDRRRRQRRGYVELQVAPNGTLFDTYLPERRKYEDTVDPKLKPFSWNSKLQAKVRVDGTLNKREDRTRAGRWSSRSRSRTSRGWTPRRR